MPVNDKMLRYLQSLVANLLYSETDKVVYNDEDGHYYLEADLKPNSIRHYDYRHLFFGITLDNTKSLNKNIYKMIIVYSDLLEDMVKQHNSRLILKNILKKIMLLSFIQFFIETIDNDCENLYLDKWIDPFNNEARVINSNNLHKMLVYLEELKSLNVLNTITLSNIQGVINFSYNADFLNVNKLSDVITFLSIKYPSLARSMSTYKWFYNKILKTIKEV